MGTSRCKTKPRLHLARAAWHGLRAHAEAAYPEECCGALLGHPTPGGWSVTTAQPAANAAASGQSYQIAPAELVRIAREANRQGLVLAGFYHSHPDQPALWSETDLTEATWPGCAYLITAVAAGRAGASRAYLLAGAEEKHFAPMTIEIAP
jgi:proteasome lid subunit RPN8/RPN11